MGGFGPLAASLGFFLRGQQQGEQQQNLEALKAQILRRQAMASTKQIVDMGDGTFRIIDLADPSTAAGQTIGNPIDYTQRLQALSESAPAYLKPLITRAIKSNDKDFQRQVATGALTTMEKPPRNATLNPYYARAMTDNGLDDESDVTAPMLAKAYQDIQNENSGRIAARTPPQIIQESGVDPNTGLPFNKAYRVPKRAGEATEIMTGGGTPGSAPTPLMGRKESGTETKMIENIQATIPQIEDLRANLEALGPEKWNRSMVLRQFDYQRAKHLNVFPADPDLAKVMSQAIQVETQIKAALASAAGIRAINFINQSAGHIPTGFGDYNSMLENIDVLLAPNGPYRAMLQATGVTGAAKGGEAPTTKGQSLQDRGYVQLPDGTWFNPKTNKYDDGK